MQPPSHHVLPSMDVLSCPYSMLVLLMTCKPYVFCVSSRGEREKENKRKRKEERKKKDWVSRVTPASFPRLPSRCTDIPCEGSLGTALGIMKMTRGVRVTYPTYEKTLTSDFIVR